jgi:uncharacterized protein YodC (DUF2158 family)
MLMRSAAAADTDCLARHARDVQLTSLGHRLFVEVASTRRERRSLAQQVGKDGIDKWVNSGGKRATVSEVAMGMVLERRAGKILGSDRIDRQLRYRMWSCGDLCCYHVYSKAGDSGDSGTPRTRRAESDESSPAQCRPDALWAAPSEPREPPELKVRLHPMVGPGKEPISSLPSSVEPDRPASLQDLWAMPPSPPLPVEEAHKLKETAPPPLDFTIRHLEQQLLLGKPLSASGVAMLMRSAAAADTDCLEKYKRAVHLTSTAQRLFVEIGNARNSRRSLAQQLGKDKIDKWVNSGGKRALVSEVAMGMVLERRAGKILGSDRVDRQLRYHMWSCDEVCCYHVFVAPATSKPARSKGGTKRKQQQVQVTVSVSHS